LSEFLHELQNRNYLLCEAQTDLSRTSVSDMEVKKHYSDFMRESTEKASKIPVTNVNQFCRSLIRYSQDHLWWVHFQKKNMKF